MNSTTTTPTHNAVVVMPRRRWLVAAASMVVAAAPIAAAPAREQPMSELELAREELAHLCEQMEMLRAWWRVNGDYIRDFMPDEAAHVHDSFIDGVISSRQVARRAGIIIDMDHVNSTMGDRA